MTETRDRTALPWQGATLLVVLCGTALLGVGVPMRQARIQRQTNETAALATLRYLCLRMNEFHDACVIDQDRDGRGEFPFIAEITGLVAPRAGDGQLAAAPARNFLARTILGDTALADGGTAHKSGYCFRIHLPAGDGSFVADPGRPGVGRPIDADSQERAFVIYAWPEEAGVTGVRAFTITQDADPHATPIGGPTEYSGTSQPPPADALATNAGAWDSVWE